MSISPPTQSAFRNQRMRSHVRSIAGFMASEARGAFLEDEMQRNWPSEKDALLQVKAAVSPMTTASDSGQWSPSIVADVINIMAAQSAGAAVLDNGLKIGKTNDYGTIIPSVAVSASNGAGVAEASPIPIGELNVTGSNVLARREMKVIVTATREIFTHSIPTWEALIKAAYIENLHQRLDADVFSATAGSSTVSAGLLNGIAALTKSVKTDEFDAMVQDIQTVAGVVSAVASGGKIILVAGPKRAIKLQMWADRVPFQVYGSNAVEEGDLIAVACNGVASSLDDSPTFEASREATLVMRTDPGAFSSVGAPATVQAPIRSLFQTDSVGIKIRFGASWLRRSDSAVSWLDGITTW